MSAFFVTAFAPTRAEVILTDRQTAVLYQVMRGPGRSEEIIYGADVCASQDKTHSYVGFYEEVEFSFCTVGLYEKVEYLYSWILGGGICTIGD